MLLSIFLKWFCQVLFGQYTVKFFLTILGKIKISKILGKNLYI